MTHIIFNDQRIDLEEEQTVLSALLEHGYKIPNSCRAGVCQTCLMQAQEGDVPEKAQQGLKDTLRAQGYFLACSCTPEKPLRVTTADIDALRCTATVIGHELFAEDVLHLRLKPEQDFDYRAGQYITLWKDHAQGRNYSLASVAELDELIELHVRRIPGGTISNWLHDEIKEGDSLQIQAATGNCFYLPGSPGQNMLLAGTGTGLAPLIGIARDALRQGHEGDIHLIHGARQIDDLYLHETLVNMALTHRQFHYHANVLEAEHVLPPISMNPLEQQIIEVADNPADWRIYLCGDAPMVNSLKRELFIAGASMGNIYTDPFVSANNLYDETA
jgi:ferredoxin-NADP reductase